MVCEFYSKKLHSDSGCFLICLVALEAHMQTIMTTAVFYSIWMMNSNMGNVEFTNFVCYKFLPLCIEYLGHRKLAGR